MADHAAAPGAETALAGGFGSGGMVVRVGDTVRRPWLDSSPASQALLGRLDDVLPGVAPRPLGRDEQGREVISWVDGDVPVPPFPGYAAEPAFLESVGRLLRRVHDALEGWTPPRRLVWSGELRDPEPEAGHGLIVHCDVCPENVVTENGRAVGLIDWEMAAPGRRIWDVVSTARLCVPFTAPSRRDAAFADVDVAGRLRLFVDAYDLGDADRADFTRVLDQRRQAGERFVLDRVARGQKEFVEKWSTRDGRHRLAIERDWIASIPRDVVARTT